MSLSAYFDELAIKKVLPNTLVFTEELLGKFCVQSTAQFPGWAGPGSILVGYVPLAIQNPYSIIVYFVASYRPHTSRFFSR